MSTEKKYNVTVAGLWKTKTGSLMSMPVDARVLDALKNASEGGGKLVIKFLREESRKTEKSPHAFLEYMSKEEVDGFSAGKAKGGTEDGGI